MSIALPQDPNTRHLAALIYGEASPSSFVSEEMRAVGWSVRNRYEHVNMEYGHPDRRWFGEGSSYRSIIEHGQEFIAADGPRYRRFLDGLADVSNRGELEFAAQCISAAEAIVAGPKPAIPGRSGSYPYIWFQKGRTSPNPRRAVAEPTKLGAHNFWSFAEGKERG